MQLPLINPSADYLTMPTRRLPENHTDRKVEELHFLVHPAVNLNMEINEIYLDTMDSVDRYSESYWRNAKRHDRRLLKAYHRKIDSLGENDALGILLPNFPSQLKQDASENREWVEIARYGKQKLGRRCVVVSAPLIIKSIRQFRRNVENVVETLRSRGLTINKKRPVSVWGQEFFPCVPAHTHAIDQMGFRKISIPLEATSAGFCSENEIERLREMVNSQPPTRVKFTLNGKPLTQK